MHTRQKICIFVDGEYFHGRDWENGQKERVQNGANADYWVPKIERNMKRDRRNDADLTGMGWTVLRFWSKDVLKHPEQCLQTVTDAVFAKKIDSVQFDRIER